MNKPIIFSLIESPEHPRLSRLYSEMGYDEMQFPSVRKVIGALKKYQPEVIVAQFFYAYSTNYASNYISNLDSLLVTLQKNADYKPTFIFLVHKEDHQYLHQLTDHYNDFSKINHTFILPVKEDKIREVL